MRRSLLSTILATAVVTLVRCGGSDSPTAPGTPSGSGVVVSGRVVGTIGGGPVTGARVSMGGAVATTDGGGSFQVTVPGGSDLRVEISAGGHVTRTTYYRAAGSAPVFDVVEPSSVWNLDFYRELVRDGAGGGSLKALSPITREMRFYIDRRPEQGLNRVIPDSAVETVRGAIQTVVPLLTRGRFTGAQIEEGETPPADRTPGTVVIRWNPVEVSQLAGAAAGLAYQVGGDWNVVVLRNIESTESIFHELGHVLGLYHPLGGFRQSLMIGPGVPERPHFTQWDILHANVLYARPAGNTDVDNDPAGFTVN